MCVVPACACCSSVSRSTWPVLQIRRLLEHYSPAKRRRATIPTSAFGFAVRTSLFGSAIPPHKLNVQCMRGMHPSDTVLAWIPFHHFTAWKHRYAAKEGISWRFVPLESEPCQPGRGLALQGASTSLFFPRRTRSIRLHAVSHQASHHDGHEHSVESIAVNISKLSSRNGYAATRPAQDALFQRWSSHARCHGGGRQAHQCSSQYPVSAGSRIAHNATRHWCRV